MRRAVTLAAAFIAATIVVALTSGAPARAQDTTDKPGDQKGEEPDPRAGAELRKQLGRINSRKAVDRVSALSSIGGLGRAAKSAIPQVGGKLKDSDETVRCAAAYALGRIDDGSPNVVTALIAALVDQTTGRGAAAFALGEFGEKSSSAIAALIKALQTTNVPFNRSNIERALGLIGVSDAPHRKTVLEMLRAEIAKGADRGARIAAAGALARLGEQDAATVPILSEAAACKNDERDSRREAAEALARLGAVAEPAIPQLTAVLQEQFVETPGLPYQDQVKHTHDEMRAAAARALGAIGVPAKSSIPALRAVIQEGEETDLGKAATEAVAAINGTS